VVILGIAKGGPASRAGLKAASRTWGGIRLGDVIVGIDDKAVADYDDLYNALDGRHPGERVVLKVQRENETVSVPVDLTRLE
jgi:S1-C subfamily serine protease